MRNLKTQMRSHAMCAVGTMILSIYLSVSSANMHIATLIAIQDWIIEYWELNNLGTVQVVKSWCDTDLKMEMEKKMGKIMRRKLLRKVQLNRWSKNWEEKLGEEMIRMRNTKRVNRMYDDGWFFNVHLLIMEVGLM